MSGSRSVQSGWAAAGAAALVLFVAVGVAPEANRAVADPPGADGPGFGEPLPGLTREQLAGFHAGREAFEEEEGVADGVGPVFNDTSCAACHNGEATGGSSDVLSTQIGTTVGGRFDPLVRFGGPTIQRKGIIGLREYEFAGEVVPHEATIVALRRATQVFGLGLVDAVPDEDLILLARTQERTDPETAGVPNVVPDLRTGDPQVGRFGWKAQVGSVFDFSADAYKDEMGITIPGFIRTADGRTIGEENAPQGDVEALIFNPVASPNEPDLEDIELFTDFITFLAPPPRGPITRDVRAGQAVFERVGCAACHVPTLRTGPHRARALDRVTFHPYSDFLLHDMGLLGDGIEQGTGTGRQMRTAPLWGLRVQPAFLHDGRAGTIEEAILLHDGQGLRSRNLFRELDTGSRRLLLAFLNSL